MHGVFEFGDVGVLRNVVDRCGGQTEADLAVLFVVQIDEAMPDIHRSERILRVVVVELIEPRRIREGGFYFQTVAARPIAGDLGRTFETEARRLVVVVDAGIGVRFYVVIPPQNGAVALSIDRDRDFFIALRTVVASSSATLSSRSEQQSPPRSAAFAGLCVYVPINKAAPAATSRREHGPRPHIMIHPLFDVVTLQNR